MNCGDMRDLIPLHAGGELQENERVALEAHLPQCGDCAREASAYRESRALLSGLKEGDPPSGTYPKIWAEVRNAFFPARIHRMSWALAHAALLLIGISLGFLFTMFDSKVPAPDQADVLSPADEELVNVRDARSGRFASEGSETFPEGLRIRRFRIPEFRRPTGSFHLPSVRTVRSDGEVDF
jgi:anti-sigma factor RsiW